LSNRGVYESTSRRIGTRNEDGERRRVRSDWMAVERERGISVSSAVMSFEHDGLAFNLLNTPSHQDFSPVEF
jgi:peptide chain release factor 3